MSFQTQAIRLKLPCQLTKRVSSFPFSFLLWVCEAVLVVLVLRRRHFLLTVWLFPAAQVLLVIFRNALVSVLALPPSFFLCFFPGVWPCSVFLPGFYNSDNYPFFPPLFFVDRQLKPGY